MTEALIIIGILVVCYPLSYCLIYISDMVWEYQLKLLQRSTKNTPGGDLD